MIVLIGLAEKRLRSKFGFHSLECEDKQGAASKVSNDEQVTPRTVSILGGKDVISPSNLEDLRTTTAHENRQ